MASTRGTAEPPLAVHPTTSSPRLPSKRNGGGGEGGISRGAHHPGEAGAAFARPPAYPRWPSSSAGRVAVAGAARLLAVRAPPVLPADKCPHRPLLSS